MRLNLDHSSRFIYVDASGRVSPPLDDYDLARLALGRIEPNEPNATSPALGAVELVRSFNTTAERDLFILAPQCKGGHSLRQLSELDDEALLEAPGATTIFLIREPPPEIAAAPLLARVWRHF